MDFQDCEIIIISNESYVDDAKEDKLIHKINLNDDVKGIDNTVSKDFPKICRTCLYKGKVKPIFDSSKKSVTIPQLLKDCVALQVEKSDKLPHNICEVCIKKLLDIYSFKKQCCLNESTLRLILLSTPSDDEEEIEDELNTKVNDYAYVASKKKGKSKSEKPVTLVKTDDTGIDYTGSDNDHELYSKVQHDAYMSLEGNDSIENKEVLLSENHSPHTIYRDDDHEMGSDAVGVSSDTAEEHAFHTYCAKIKEKSKEEKPSVKCRHCSEAFESRVKLRRHQIDKHLRHRKVMCNVCNKLIGSNNIKYHMRTHTKEKPYECKLCKKTFSLVENLKRHFMIHTGERPHVCNTCGKGFIQSTSLQKHIKTHHEAISATRDIIYSCEFCHQSFKRELCYKLHLKRHDPETGSFILNPINEPEKCKAFLCDICKKGFATKSSLKFHKSIHGDRPFLCSLCGKVFATNLHLQQHTRTHTGKKPYVCQECNRSFAQINSLDSHMLVHRGLKPHTCNTCGKKFTQKPHLMYHLRTHSGERPYHCTYCEKTFAQKGNLTVHVRMHTGETPYLCKYCNRGFYDSSSRNKHQKGHASKDTTKNEEESGLYQRS